MADLHLRLLCADDNETTDVFVSQDSLLYRSRIAHARTGQALDSCALEVVCHEIARRRFVPCDGDRNRLRIVVHRAVQEPSATCLTIKLQVQPLSGIPALPSPPGHPRSLVRAPADGHETPPPAPPATSPCARVGSAPVVTGGSSALLEHGTDLTSMAARGLLKPVFCRDAEVERVLKVLHRMEANNPVLLGPAGVGKTAVVEGLAIRLATGAAAPSSRVRRIVSLNLTSLVAGTKYRGEFEERLQALMQEVKAQLPGIVLFIDEIHMLLGAGGAEGAWGAHEALKPVLARGEFPVIGATTAAEYRRTVATDAALARRFQPVAVAEMNAERAFEILDRLRPVYEGFHGVSIPRHVCWACVHARPRGGPQCLPGRAIRLLDGAAASARVSGRRVLSEEDVREEVAQQSWEADVGGQ